MKFGLFYEFQVPRPWDGSRTEASVLREALEQVELADRLGFHCVWEVEHHFLEEYSHSSAPEVFLAAASQRTENIRLGHGIVPILPGYNHPARVVERASTLDILSGGRVELGTGETSTAIELGGFVQDRERKRELWEEVMAELPRMFVENPYRGHEGPAFSMPPRNVLPKPLQQPHPPLWVACSRRETITLAAQRAIGALTFSFIDAPEAKQWVDHYHETLLDEGTPVGFAANPNVAIVTGMMCCEDEQEAIDKGIDGVHFFAYSLAHYMVFGQHQPGRTNVWDEFQANRELMGMSRKLVVADGKPLTARVSTPEEMALEDAGGLVRGALKSLRGAVGTPDQIREFVRGFEEAGVDQVIFIAQAGATKHEDICESLELFGREVLPEFLERDAAAEEAKRKRLEPVLEKVMARRPAEVAPPEPPLVPADAAI